MRFFIFKDRYEIANGGVVVDEGKITDWMVEPVAEVNDLTEIRIIKAGRYPLEIMLDYIQFSDNSLIEPVPIGKETVYFGYMHLEKNLVMTIASTDLKEVEEAIRKNKKWVYEDLILKYLRDVEGVEVDDVFLETDEILVDDEVVSEEEIKNLKKPSSYIPVVEEHLADFVNFLINYRQNSPEANMEEVLQNYEIRGGREHEIQ